MEFPKTYQIAGLDDRERGFNRQARVTKEGETYQAILRYESLRLTGPPCETESLALQALIRHLQERGYTQLRSQLIFRGEHYLGNQEMWVEHEDPVASTDGEFGVKTWLRRVFRWI